MRVTGRARGTHRGPFRKMVLRVHRLAQVIVQGGQMTKDLALLVGPDTPYLNTREFLDALDGNLRAAMANI